MAQLDADDPVGLYGRLRRRWGADRLVLYGEHLRLWLPGGADDEDALRAALAAESPPPAWRYVEPTLEDAFVARVLAPAPEEAPA